jgi:nucleotide-binding universal stress UspA family protein
MLLGSVTTDVLVDSFGPVVVVGPEVDIDRSPGGELVVAVDGSEASESALGLAGAWGIGLCARPWIVSVGTEGAGGSADTFDTGYPSRIAHRLQSMTGQPVEFEALHGRHPADAIADFARSIDAWLIIASTHGRTGLSRLAHGSVAAALVRHARCPVVLMRPPSLPASSRSSELAGRASTA